MRPAGSPDRLHGRPHPVRRVLGRVRARPHGRGADSGTGAPGAGGLRHRPGLPGLTRRDLQGPGHEVTRNRPVGRGGRSRRRRGSGARGRAGLLDRMARRILGQHPHRHSRIPARPPFPSRIGRPARARDRSAGAGPLRLGPGRTHLRNHRRRRERLGWLIDRGRPRRCDHARLLRRHREPRRRPDAPHAPVRGTTIHGRDDRRLRTEHQLLRSAVRPLPVLPGISGIHALARRPRARPAGLQRGHRLPARGGAARRASEHSPPC